MLETTKEEVAQLADKVNQVIDIAIDQKNLILELKEQLGSSISHDQELAAKVDAALAREIPEPILPDPVPPTEE